MPKKEPLTPKEIKYDISKAIRLGLNTTKAQFEKTNVFMIALEIILMLAVKLINRYLYLFTILTFVLLIHLILTLMIKWYKTYRIKTLTLEDYEITTDILCRVSEESFEEDYGFKRTTDQMPVKNYFFHFEGGSIWHIPESLYIYGWSEKHNTSTLRLYENARCGNAFILVKHKQSGKTVMAYDTEIFEYNDGYKT